jgi:hypothetical protein
VIATKEHISNLKLQPLTINNWLLFEEVMGEKGGCGGCWCMYFRLSLTELPNNKYDGHKKRMYDLVKAGNPTGLIATINKQAIGWIAFAIKP